MDTLGSDGVHSTAVQSLSDHSYIVNGACGMQMVEDLQVLIVFSHRLENCIWSRRHVLLVSILKI